MEEQPELISASHEAFLKKQIMWQQGDNFSYTRIAKEDIMPAAGNYNTLKHSMAMTARALDIARTTGSLAHVEAFLHQSWKVTESVIRSPSHQWEWTWPLLDLPSPVKPDETSLAPNESHALASFHRDRFTLQQAAGKYLPAGGGKGGAEAPPGNRPPLSKEERAALDKKKKEEAAQRKKDAGTTGA
jgi:hypothetical protein